VTLATALEALLEQVRSSNELSFEPKGGVIVVSTTGDLALESSVRFYDVRDVIRGPEWLEEARRVLGATKAKEWGLDEHQMGQLWNLLVAWDQDTWSEDDESDATLIELNGLLAIRQPWRGHEAFEELLARLRERTAATAERGEAGSATLTATSAPPPPPPASVSPREGAP
jgi:hypothetical protein